MPNPLIKWAKRNTHSDPPPIPWGLERLTRPLSFPHSHPQGKEGKKGVFFQTLEKSGYRFFTFIRKHNILHMT